MTKRMEIYKCDVCGNITEIMHGEGVTMLCCGENMKLLTENITDAATEKHVPVVEKVDGGYRVTVGEVEHPMNDDHYIEWIELIAGNEVYTKFLNPGESPVAIFKTDALNVYARAYCNLHGNWRNNND